MNTDCFINNRMEDARIDNDIKLRTVSLFSGCGGFDYGLQNVGYEIVWANDIDRFACKTYSENFTTQIVNEDIYNIDPASIPDCDVVTAGFPCQPFSMMGAEKGFTDNRGGLFFRIAEIVKQMMDSDRKPKVLVLENVRNIVTHDGGRTLDEIIRVLHDELEYKVYYRVLNSADFGVPQTRNRVFIVCFSDDNVSFDFPEAKPLTITLKDILEEDVDEKYLLSDRMIKTVLSNGTGGYHAKSEIDLSIARPLCATMGKMHRACQDNYVTQNGRIRRLTPRECARLQGFRDDFRIPVSDFQAYKQFGNCVTTTVAECIGEQIKRSLRLYDS